MYTIFEPMAARATLEVTLPSQHYSKAFFQQSLAFRFVETPV
jgi:hypothetical protein